MLYRIANLVKIARGMPWPLLATRGLRKLGFQSSWTRSVDFLCSPDTARPTKAVEILLNSMRIARLPEAPLAAAIPGAVLLEIGCGRHIGFAPFSLGLVVSVR